MTDPSAINDGDYTKGAYKATLSAAREEQDFAGWLAGVLAQAAVDLGSPDALIACRPGTWEAAHVRALVNSTVGWEDGFLADHRRAL